MSGDQNKSSFGGQAGLQGWTTWQKEWQKVQGKIAKKLEREPEDLVMNYAEGIRQIIAEKQVLDYAKIPTKFDKYRGKPDFYKLPDALPKKFKCCYAKEEAKCSCGSKVKKEKYCCYSTEPTYFMVKSKPESFIVPEVHLVGTPDAVRDKKNILNGSRNIYKKWQQSKYRQQQMAKWAEKIRNIVPHWPEMEHLAVIGTSITKPEESTRKEKEQEEKDVYTDREKPKMNVPPSALCKTPRLSLKLNGISLDNCEDRGCRKVRLFFDYDICTAQIMVHFLEFENSGLATMRVSWRKLEKFRLFRNYTNEPWEKHGFYFTRKELIILPGHHMSVPVWFKTENAGNYSESWELVTNPRLWSEDFQVILILQSYAYFKDLQESADLMVKHIEKEAKNLLMKGILRDALEAIKYVDKPVVTCFYGVPQLFEMANLANGRPLFLFNEVFFKKLKRIYDTVKVDECSCGWDYSIKQLQRLAHEKDVALYGEKKLSEIIDNILEIEGGLNKGKSPSKTLKDKQKEGKEEKTKGKKLKNESSKKNETDTTETKEDKREPYVYSSRTEVWNLVRQFDSPVIINRNREKHAACFHVMGFYFTKMCHLLEQLEKNKKIITQKFYPLQKNKLTPINEQPERMVYEYFEDHYIPFHSCDDFYPFEVKRKPVNLKDVSSDDPEAIYTAYFNKPTGKKDDKQKKGKSKGESSAELKGKKKDKSGSKSSVSKEKVKKDVSLESFNPHAENFIYQSENEEDGVTPPSGTVILSREAKEDYQYKQYLIVYSCLSNVVDAVFDTLESFECVVPYPTIDVVGPQFPNESPAREDAAELDGANTDVEKT